MTREDVIRRHFDRSQRLLEIGPSYRPIVPKTDGWQTIVVDHASQADLIAKYGAMKVASVDCIEPVDYVWRDGRLTELIPSAMHGGFDGLVASHVGKHFPDLIAFFKDASVLIKPDGLMALALPDKRVCFDFFQPMTTTGDLVDAHYSGRTRHQRRAFFNHTAYFTTRDGEGGWAHTGNTTQFQLANSIFQAQQAYESATEDPALPYRDCHAWTFTPKSFELLMLELNLLGHVDWSIHSVEPASGVEFYVWLQRKRVIIPEAEINPARLALLTAVIHETKEVIAQCDAADLVTNARDETAAEKVKQTAGYQGRPMPTIVVVIPLYNGARHIEDALQSVFRQTLPANEIIVVDDGSVDNGAGVAVVERLAKVHPVKLLRKMNGGQSSARNLGVAESSSDLIAFLDQDDAWYDHHLQELVVPFCKAWVRPLGWVYSNLDEINEGGSLVCRDFLSTLRTVHPKRAINDCIAQDMYVLPSAALISRKAFEAVGGFDERLCGYEDDDLFLRIFREGYENIYLDMALSKWRIHRGSTSYSPRMTRSRSIYTRKLIEMYPGESMFGCHYGRDLIVPRFVVHAVREYENAVRMGDPVMVDEAWAEMQFLADYDRSLKARLFNQTLRHYRSALMQGNDAVISAAWAHMAEALAELPAARLRVRTTVSLLRNPTISKTLFAARGFARPAMRWAFSA